MQRASKLPKAGKEVVFDATKLRDAEARALVANYYMAQEMRKASDMQIRHIGERALVPQLTYTADSFAIIENENAKMLQKYAESSAVGRWCMAHVGVGPVITAGLLAHLDITKAPTAGHFLSFAGLDPNKKWEKGQKRPYCAAVKQLVFHLGECFKRTSGSSLAYYGSIYRARKKLLEQRNENGHYAERAKTYFTFSADVKKTLSTGKLPAGNLDRQACNYAAKIFICHLHGVMYWNHFKAPPPRPYPIAHLGHAHEIKIQRCDLFPGLEAAYYANVAVVEAAE